MKTLKKKVVTLTKGRWMWGICRHLFLSLFQRNNLVPVGSFGHFDADLAWSTVRCSSRKESEDHQVTTAETWERSSVQVSTLGWIIFSSRKTEKVTFNPYNKMYKSFKQMPYLKKILPYSVNLHHAKKTDKPRSYLISSIIRLLVIILKSNYCEMN